MGLLIEGRGSGVVELGGQVEKGKGGDLGDVAVESLEPADQVRQSPGRQTRDFFGVFAADGGRFLLAPLHLGGEVEVVDAEIEVLETPTNLGGAEVAILLLGVVGFHGDAQRSPEMKGATASGPWRSTRRMVSEPITAMSALPVMAMISSRLRMPKPTARGSLVAARQRAR